MTITTHRDASFYVVAIPEPSRSRCRAAEGAECWSASAFNEARDHVLLLYLLPLPVLFFACRSPSRLFRLWKAPFSNDGQRGLRQRGNLLALRRIRADCLPFGVSKRTQTSLTPTVPLQRSGETRLCSPRWDQDLMWRATCLVTSHTRPIPSRSSSVHHESSLFLSSFFPNVPVIETFYPSCRFSQSLFKRFLEYKNESFSRRWRERLLFSFFSLPSFSSYGFSTVHYFSRHAIKVSILLVFGGREMKKLVQRSFSSSLWELPLLEKVWCIDSAAAPFKFLFSPDE